MPVLSHKLGSEVLYAICFRRRYLPSGEAIDDVLSIVGKLRFSIMYLLPVDPFFGQLPLSEPFCHVPIAGSLGLGLLDSGIYRSGFRRVNRGYGLLDRLRRRLRWSWSVCRDRGCGRNRLHLF